MSRHASKLACNGGCPKFGVASLARRDRNAPLHRAASSTVLGEPAFREFLVHRFMIVSVALVALLVPSAARAQSCEHIRAQMNAIAANASWADLARLQQLQSQYYACQQGKPKQPAGPPPGVKTFESTHQEMARKNNYCGTDGTNTYYCPKGRACITGQLGKCTPAKAAAPKPTEAQAASAADKIKAEQAKASATATEKVSNLSVAAGLVASVSKFTELGTKTQAAVPATSSAGFKGWTREAERNKEVPDGRGYCTDYARSVWEKVTGNPLPDGMGDAGKWYENAQAKGLKTASAVDIDKVPPGSVAVWSDGNLGHVAVVVSNDGKALKVTEANWGPLRGDANDFEKKNAITQKFNQHDETSLPYATARERGSKTKYKLIGFVLPE